MLIALPSQVARCWLQQWESCLPSQCTHPPPPENAGQCHGIGHIALPWADLVSSQTMKQLGSVAEPPKVTLAHRHKHRLVLTRALGFFFLLSFKLSHNQGSHVTGRIIAVIYLLLSAPALLAGAQVTWEQKDQTLPLLEEAGRSPPINTTHPFQRL